jgi:hypothetical protein
MISDSGGGYGDPEVAETIIDLQTAVSAVARSLRDGDEHARIHAIAEILRSLADIARLDLATIRRDHPMSP